MDCNPSKEAAQQLGGGRTKLVEMGNERRRGLDGSEMRTVADVKARLDHCRQPYQLALIQGQDDRWAYLPVAPCVIYLDSMPDNPELKDIGMRDIAN